VFAVCQLERRNLQHRTTCNALQVSIHTDGGIDYALYPKRLGLRVPTPNLYSHCRNRQRELVPLLI
jgi:hypothetical protein